MGKLTAIVLAKNEENNIADCLKSISFADEILVIDDFSTDQTVEIALTLGARVVQHALDGNWGQQKTFAIKEASNPWIYFIDADERMTEPLKQEIIKAISKDEKTAYMNARLNHLCGSVVKHGGWFPDYGIHLIPKEGSYVTGYVHETIHCDCPIKKLPAKAYLLHYTYTSWEQYVRKINTYTTLGAKAKFEAGSRASFWDIISHTFFGIIKIFIFQRAFLDGKTGIMLTAGHGISVFLKYTKLYYLCKEKE